MQRPRQCHVSSPDTPDRIPLPGEQVLTRVNAELLYMMQKDTLPRSVVSTGGSGLTAKT